MDKTVEEFVANYPDWYVEDEQLVAGFEFKDFKALQKMVGKIMKLADKQNHHPTVTFGYKTVEVKTVTHEAENSITDKDFELASKISEMVTGK